jgi:hypothetical protein
MKITGFGYGLNLDIGDWNLSGVWLLVIDIWRLYG